MALTQIIELHTEQFGTVTLTSKAYTLEARAEQDILHDHRNKGGLGSFSIGHFGQGGNFIVPNNN